MSIVLPEPQEETARQRAGELGLTPEEYLAHVVQMEAFEAHWATLTPEEQEAHLETERLLDEALDSGPPIDGEESYRRAKQWLFERRARGATGGLPTSVFDRSQRSTDGQANSGTRSATSACQTGQWNDEYES